LSSTFVNGGSSALLRVDVDILRECEMKVFNGERYRFVTGNAIRTFVRPDVAVKYLVVEKVMALIMLVWTVRPGNLLDHSADGIHRRSRSSSHKLTSATDDVSLIPCFKWSD
jgi:hypothetical protein